jgi:hypothetical protein
MKESGEKSLLHTTNLKTEYAIFTTDLFSLYYFMAYILQGSRMQTHYFSITFFFFFDCSKTAIIRNQLT